jgi:hypothetical protein
MGNLLAALVPDAGRRRAVTGLLREQFARESGLVGRWSRPLGEQFRKERDSLLALFEGALAKGHRLWEGRLALLERDAAIANLVHEICVHDEPCTAQVCGILHLHANRLLATEHRLQEAFLYDFLDRFERRACHEAELRTTSEKRR